MKRLCYLLALLLVVGPGLPAAAQTRQSATIADIVDGDTIKVRTDSGQALTVRLIGIDTPETKHPTKPVQCFGSEASRKTAELLPIGTVVDLERDVQERDRYGRTLAYVWVPDRLLMVNEQLVAEGYAVVLTIPPNVRYAESFLNAQRIARDNGMGLWSGCQGVESDPSDDAPIMDEQPPAGAPPGPAPAAKPVGNCHPSYPDFCIPPPPPDLNCTSPALQGRTNFTVLQPDPHRFDGDRDGVGCESRR